MTSHRLDTPFLPLACAAAMACLPLAALAQGADAPPPNAASAPSAASAASAAPAIVTLPTVRVKAAAGQESPTGPVNGYQARRATTATKTDTPLKDTPLSVTVLTRDLIVDQGATNVQDALNYAAGVRPDAYGLDSRTDSALIRGAYPDEYLDGLRKNFGYYSSNARTDPYTLERIEVLRGPAGMLFGQGSVGGVINMVSKRPKAETQGEIHAEVGNRRHRQMAADITGPLTADGQWLYRLIGVVRQADTQVQGVSDGGRLVAPSLTWKPGAATTLTLQGLVQRDRTGSTSQFFPWAGTASPNPNGPLPPHRFIGEPGDHYDTDRESFGWLVEHQFDERWAFTHKLRYSHNLMDYRSFYGDSFTEPGGWAEDPINQRLLGRYGYAERTTSRLLAADQNLRGTFDLGGIQHELLFGVDLALDRKRGQLGSALPESYDDGSYPAGTVFATPIDAYAPVYGRFTAPPLSPYAPSSQRQLGLYAQDQLRLDKHWLLTVGLRHDRARNRTAALGAETASVEEHRATTKRAGVLYAADSGWSPYLSYSESFTPLSNVDGFALKPLHGKQWETGVKYAPRGMPLSANLAVYRVRELNQTVDNPLPGQPPLQLGQTETRGVEFDLAGEIARSLEATFNYTYTDHDANIEQGPRHIASAWGKWRLASLGLPGASGGLGVRYLSSYHDGPAPTLPSWTLFDAVLAWEEENWRAALNVNNLADKIYIASCGARGDCWFGARRTATLSLAYRW